VHFEILVEDQSGSVTVANLFNKIVQTASIQPTMRLHPYKGLGVVPKDLKPNTKAKERILLDRLPKILQGYGKNLKPHSVVLVVVDLDVKDCKKFKKELLDLLNQCKSKPPQTQFRIAIEEIEAWLLGDRDAVRRAYPKCKSKPLENYKQDSICGTWEVLAESLFSGGAKELKKQGYPRIGEEKCNWAKKISPLIDIEQNQSKSFQVFRQGVLNIIQKHESEV